MRTNNVEPELYEMEFRHSKDEHLKRQQSTMLAADVEKYLASGGKIKSIEVGVIVNSDHSEFRKGTIKNVKIIES